MNTFTDSVPLKLKTPDSYRYGERHRQGDKRILESEHECVHIFREGNIHCCVPGVKQTRHEWLDVCVCMSAVWTLPSQVFHLLTGQTLSLRCIMFFCTQAHQSVNISFLSLFCCSHCQVTITLNIFVLIRCESLKWMSLLVCELEIPPFVSVLNYWPSMCNHTGN